MPSPTTWVPLVRVHPNHMATDWPWHRVIEQPRHTPAEIAEYYRRWSNRMPNHMTTSYLTATPFPRRF